MDVNVYVSYTIEQLKLLIEERKQPSLLDPPIGGEQKVAATPLWGSRQSTEGLLETLDELVQRGSLAKVDASYTLVKGGPSFSEEHPLLSFLMSLQESHQAPYRTIMLECQKTKTFQMIHQMFQIVGIDLFSPTPCVQESGKKVFFLVSQNLQDLTAQSCDRISRELGDHLQLFVFSSYKEKGSGRKGSPIAYNPDLMDVIHYIGAYLDEDEAEAHAEVEGKKRSLKIPLCIFLANPQQYEKMRQILEVIMGHQKEIYSYLFFDEADQTYPVGRDILLPYIYDHRVKEEYGVIRAHPSLRRVYWISATMEEMVMEYEECQIARQSPIRFQDGVVENHYSILDETAILHYQTQPKTQDHNSYFLGLLDENREHFFNPITLPSGETCYRKIIALTSKENEKQCSMARIINTMGGNVIILNQAGTFLLKALNPEEEPEEPSEDEVALTEPSEPEVALTDPSEEACLEAEAEAEAEVDAEPRVKKRFVMREGIRLDDPKIRSRNELIAKVYHELYPELKQAPLFILGNRKVDRGLTFHYAPLDHEVESFVLTDVVMGRISQWRRAVQAIGRGNGVIKHRRDIPSGIDYWVDPGTYKVVTRHCRMMRDPLLFDEASTLTASEMITLLNEKYPDEEEEAVAGAKRTPYIYERAPTRSSYPEMVAYMKSLYPEEASSIRKQWHNVEGTLVSSRLKKHFGVAKVGDLTPENRCTEAMLEDPAIWKKVLYATQFDFVILPYYDARENLAWTAMIKKREVSTPVPSPTIPGPEELSL